MRTDEELAGILRDADRQREAILAAQLGVPVKRMPALTDPTTLHGKHPWIAALKGLIGAGRGDIDLPKPKP